MLNGVHRPRLAAVLACSLTFACKQPCGEDTPSYTHKRFAVRVSGGIRESLVRRFHPLCPDSSAQTTLSTTYEPLMVWNPWVQVDNGVEPDILGAYVPRLAQDMGWYDSDRLGFRVLRVRLRDDARWSDDTPITADDVVATIALLKEGLNEHEDACPSFDVAGVGGRIKRVEKIEDPLWEGAPEMVEVEFKSEFFPGLFHLSELPILPAAMIEDFSDGAFDNTEPVASGPFVHVAEFTDEHYALDRNEHHWSNLNSDGPRAGENRIEQVFVSAMRSNDVAACALDQGLVDWSGDFYPSARDEFQQLDQEFHDYWAPPVHGPVLLLLNAKHPAFAEAELRIALRDAIVGSALKSGLDYFAPLAASSGLEELEDGAGKPNEQAAEQLEGAFTSAGLDRIKFTILVPKGYSDWRSAVDNGIVERLEMLLAGRSIEVDIDVLELEPECDPGSSADSCWRERVRQGDFDATLGWSEVGPQQGAVGALTEEQFLGPSPYYFFADITELSCPDEGRVNKNARYVAWDDPEIRRELCQLERGDVDRLNACVHKDLRSFYGMVDAAKTPACQDLNAVIRAFEKQVPVIPLFMAPAWGASNHAHVEGFPTAKNPYTAPSPETGARALLAFERLQLRPYD